MYNEAQIIAETAKTLSEYMERTFGTVGYEIIFSDDGSTDGSADIVNSLGLPCVRTVGYKENKGKQFDRKNVAHAVRLMHMGLEIAQGKGFNVDRTNIDRDFIMNIRMGNTSYEEIISYLDMKKSEMEEAMKNSALPENIDVEFVNDLLIYIRKAQFFYYFH